MGTSSRFRAVVFDLDDTLLKTVTQKWAHHRAVAKQVYGFDLSDDELTEHWGEPLDQLIANLYRQSDSPENMWNAMMSLEHRYPKELFDDAVQGVTDLLDAGAAVGVVTSTSHDRAVADLVRFEFPIQRMFTVLGCDNCQFHKPDPRVFDEMLQELEAQGMSKPEIAYVGDSLLDFQAAKNAGISFVAVTTGLVTADEFTQAGVRTVANSIKDVVAEMLRP